MVMPGGLRYVFDSILHGFSPPEPEYEGVWQRFWKAKEITREEYLKVTGQIKLLEVREIFFIKATGLTEERWVLRGPGGRFVSWTKL